MGFGVCEGWMATLFASSGEAGVMVRVRESEMGVWNTSGAGDLVTAL